MRSRKIVLSAVLAFGAAACQVFAGTGSISVDASKLGPRIPKTLYGIFLEDINHAVEGGMYGELIQNRGFEEANLPQGTTLQGDQLIPNRTPHFGVQPRVSDWKTRWEITSKWPAWSLITSEGSAATLDLVDTKPLNSGTPHSLQITITNVASGGRVAVANTGYWGISLVQGQEYKLTFFARAEKGFRGPVTASLESKDGKVLATRTFTKLPGENWTEFNYTFKATGTDPKAQFVLSFGSTGKVWIDWVSLFPAKTWNNRPNGMRQDIAEMVAALKPGFVRWPGGCYVEGLNVESAPNWKRTLGPVNARPGTYSPWGYWNSDGFGYHEWLQYCEDLHADALYVVNCGISCYFRSGTYVPDEGVPALIQDTLDSIEYAIGPTNTKWGALRAKNGHPKPFPLKYVEIGNESSGPRYGERVGGFYTAIKAKYPQLQIVLSSWIAGIDRSAINACGKIDVVDEHAYKGVNWSIENWNNYFENYKRGDWDLYIGEFACNGGVDRGNLLAALNDSVYMMMMEKNSDLVKMGSYAPLLVHVDDFSDWAVNLIHFDSSRVFGRASYYACKLFAENLPNVNLPTDVKYTPSANRIIGGGIGVGTFNTTAEFKDIKVESDGKTVYTSDFSKGAEGWRTESDTWAVENGAYKQKENRVSWAWLDNKDWKNVTVTLKARRLAGAEGFIINVGKDDGRNVCWNVGGWGNSQHVIQVDGSIIGKPVKERLENDRWYDVKVQIIGREMKCYLDGKLLSDEIIPRLDAIFAVSGRDEKTGDVIIKVVNSGPETADVAIKLDGVKSISPQGKVITLTSGSPKDENSFDNPKKIVPVTRTVSGVASEFKQQFPPYSLSILRVKTK